MPRQKSVCTICGEPAVDRLERLCSVHVRLVSAVRRSFLKAGLPVERPV